MKSKIQFMIAMIAFGTIGLFVRNINLSSGEIALFRGIIAGVSIYILKKIKGEKINLNLIKKEILLLFISGLAMGINWILFFQAYKYTTISLATLSYYFAPLLVMILSPLIFKEKLKKRQVFNFVMASIGLVLVIGISKLNSNLNDLYGVLFGLGAAFFYASVIILNKFIKNVTGIDRTLIQFIAAVIVLLPYLILSTGIQIIKLDKLGLINIIILGIVHTGICYYLYFSSLKDLKGQEVAILSYIDPLVAILVSVIIVGEKMTIKQAIGGFMILCFTLLNEIKD